MTPSGTLDRAAQSHAEDMLARGYYDHASPEGEDARDRYLALGGSRARLVAENIANCSPCAVVPGRTHIDEMHRRWMESPHHRENILNPGLAEFGFGIVAGDAGPLYAVQTFAGPGAPRSATGSGDGSKTAAALERSEVDDAFARALNRRREAQSLPPVDVSEALSGLAAALLPESPDEEMTLGGDALSGAAPGDWASVSALAGGCGGCGASIVEEDIVFFLDMWLGEAGGVQLLESGSTSVGFALRAYGDGRKVAAAVLGARR
jgi:hypothetical protein